MYITVMLQYFASQNLFGGLQSVASFSLVNEWSSVCPVSHLPF